MRSKSRHGGWRAAVWVGQTKMIQLFSLILLYISLRLCVCSFLTHRAISLHPPPSAACSPSLIFPLSQHNSGDQSLVAMAIKPPMQVYVCVCVSECACVCACRNNSCVQCAAHTVSASQQSGRRGLHRWCGSPRCPPVPSGFDSCLVKMLSPATLGFLSALCRIMTKFKGKERKEIKTTHTQRCQACFVSI